MAFNQTHYDAAGCSGGDDHNSYCQGSEFYQATTRIGSSMASRSQDLSERSSNLITDEGSLQCRMPDPSPEMIDGSDARPIDVSILRMILKSQRGVRRPDQLAFQDCSV